MGTDSCLPISGTLSRSCRSGWSVGTGAYGQMRPDPEAVEQLRQRGVEVETLPTDEAVRRYGELDPRRTAAALHLTC
jgi:hypothetical protein